jgi:arginine/ornithine transport system permease protein
MDWEVIFEPDNLALFGNGIVITVWLLAASLAAGGVLALIFALLLTGPWAAARWLVGAYTFVIRGTPLLIQVYLIYYGLGQLEWIQARWNDVWPWTYFKEPAFCAFLAFTLNTAGYTAEMLAGAIRETSRRDRGRPRLRHEPGSNHVAGGAAQRHAPYPARL